MIAVISECLRRLQLRRKTFLVLWGLLIAACCIYSLRLTANTDIQVLIPQNKDTPPEFFAYLQNAPFLHTLTITVGNSDGAASLLAAAAAESLRSSLIPHVLTSPGAAPAFDRLSALFAYLPVLLSVEQIAGLAPLFSPEIIRETLRRNRQLLLGPSGPAFRGIVALDPLGLRFPLLRNLAPGNLPAKISPRDGQVVDPSGNYALIIARPEAAMSDSAAAAQVMAAVRASLSSLPKEAEVFIGGSYRHTEANAKIIKADLRRVVPISLLLVAIIFFLFLRSRQALAIVAVPMASLCIAATATGIAQENISGIVLGCGGVILGITADYAIHAHYAFSETDSAQRALRGLCPPLLAGFCTTAAAFAALCTSAIPAIRQMAVFGTSAVTAALCLSLFLLPLLRRPRCGPQGEVNAPLLPAAPPAAPRAALTCALLALCVCISLAGFSRLRFDGDIRNLSYSSPEMLQDERRIRDIWGMSGEDAFIVVPENRSGEGFEHLLRKNETIRDILRSDGISASSAAPFLPSARRQKERLEAWRIFRQQQGDAGLRRLGAIAPEWGFSAAAFAPFAAWFQKEPQPITPAELEALDLGLFPRLYLAQTPEHFLAYTVLNGSSSLPQATRHKAEQAGGVFISGPAFRERTAQDVGSDILRFCLLTCAAVFCVTALFFRSPVRFCAVLLPMAAGAACTVALFLFSGTKVNMFHAVALPLVIALSIDYGIFTQAVLEGRMPAGGRKGVLVSALTTLAGFGSLLLARHPALFSLGAAVSGGVAAALLTALLIQPRTFRICTSPRTKASQG
ncbi:MAG: MMPL family transporter [Desulfovibrio sp.]|nr:MMPL family transporter [Desulfovibrio sp.]